MTAGIRETLVLLINFTPDRLAYWNMIKQWYMNTKTLLIAVLSLFFLVSCKENKTPVVYKNITGKAGELIVVMSKVAWDDKPGHLVRSTLAQAHASLPQEEPLFDVVNIPHEAFKEIFLSTRNILQTRISPIVEKPGVTFTDDLWAYPQATVQIIARSNEEFDTLFRENSGKILSYFLQAEQERLTLNYSKLYDKAVYNSLQQRFGVTLKVSPGFKITSEGKNFSWIRFETPEISQGIMVYFFPYVSDSTFTISYLLSKRDSFLRANVPGPTQGSYMATERAAPPLMQTVRHNGNYAAEVRGLWRVENDFMGGPFILLAELDAYRQRVVVFDGYVYAPSKNKRNYLRQVEAMVYSLSFPDQEKNDKINSQINMGN